MRAARIQGKVGETLFADPGFQAAKVIFVGEVHQAFGVKEAFAEVIRPELTRPGTCLALETPDGLQKKLERLQASDDLVQFVEDFTLKVFSLKSDINLASKDMVDQAVQMHLPWIKMAIEAKKSGNGVFAIDLDPSFYNDPVYSADLRLHYRNNHMAKRIERLLKSGKCDRIISINGMAHIYSTRMDGVLKSLPKLMDERKIPYHSLFLESHAAIINGVLPPEDICDLEPVLSPLIGRDYVLSGRTGLNGFFSATHFRRKDGQAFLEPLALDGKSSILIFSSAKN